MCQRTVVWKIATVAQLSKSRVDPFVGLRAYSQDLDFDLFWEAGQAYSGRFGRCRGAGRFRLLRWLWVALLAGRLEALRVFKGVCARPDVLL